MNKPTPPPAAAVKDEKPAESRRLVIKLKHTDDEAADITSFRRIIGVLRDFPGDDEVRLVVDNTKKVFKMRLPGLYVGYSPELHRRLAEVIGEDSIKLDNGE